MEILLNDCDWQIKGFWPYVPMQKKSMELGEDLMGVTDWINATVPGGVHYDLLRAGLIEDPYYEMNSLKCEWVENRWWMYKTSFDIDSKLQGKNLSLIFKGVDYKAHFYLNCKKIGEHEGMYDKICFNVTDEIKFHQKNELIVLIENAPEEMHQIGYTSKTHTQKSRFNYKWDFSTRLVNLGIWDDVLLKVTEKISLHDSYIWTDIKNEAGVINITSEIKGKTGTICKVKVNISKDDSIIRTWENEIVLESDRHNLEKQFTLENPKLWYPNGMGRQPLYEVEIKIYENGNLSDQNKFQVGIRKIEYRQNQDSAPDTLPYTFVINDIPVYIKGVNLTPFDLLYGNVTDNTYQEYINMIKKANINMVRIWGGGLIEKEYFYHLCDVHGIMVWQEFIQSSSGIDNVPSTEHHFLKLLEKTAVQAVKEKRNHVCHSVWSGGNELRDEDDNPITCEHPNINMLKNIVKKNDPGKLFYPSSASGPNEFLNIETPGMNHDVHGSWQYEGVKNHYTIYNKSDSLFHSEFGVDGCSNIYSLEKFLSKKNMRITNMKDNLIWRHHGEWWDTLKRDTTIFGEFDSLEQFIKASQFIQAEGLRYALEANRRRKFKNSGSIVWQFNEPFPNVSCTSVVDYYKVPKMAYYWMKKAYNPVHVSLKYDKLFYVPGEEFNTEIFVHNNKDRRKLKIECEIMNARGDILYKKSIKKQINANCSEKIMDVNTVLFKLVHKIFFVRLNIYNESNIRFSSNLYIFSQREKEIFSSLLKINRCCLKVETVNSYKYKIKNTGNEICLFIHGIDKSGSITMDNNYISLFPGEEDYLNVENLNTKVINKTDNLSLEWYYLNE